MGYFLFLLGFCCNLTGWGDFLSFFTLIFSIFSVAIGAASLSLVFTYPAMKRFTYWPQVFLGLAFNYGAILGYTAVCNDFNWGVIMPLYLASICWTMIYDTIYAHQVHFYYKVVWFLSSKIWEDWILNLEKLEKLNFWAQKFGKSGFSSLKLIYVHWWFFESSFLWM